MSLLTTETTLNGVEALDFAVEQIKKGEKTEIACLFAHPDDQFFCVPSVRYIMDSLPSYTLPVNIKDITLTRGENGLLPGSIQTPESLAEVRSIENQLGVLATFEGIFERVNVGFTQLAIPDGYISDHVDEAKSYITNEALLGSESMLLSFNSIGGDLHEDHISTHAIAKFFAAKHKIPLLEFGLPNATDQDFTLSHEHSAVAANFVVQHSSQFGENGETLAISHRSLLQYNSVQLHMN